MPVCRNNNLRKRTAK